MASAKRAEFNHTKDSHGGAVDHNILRDNYERVMGALSPGARWAATARATVKREATDMDRTPNGDSDHDQGHDPAIRQSSRANAAF